MAHPHDSPRTTPSTPKLINTVEYVEEMWTIPNFLRLMAGPQQNLSGLLESFGRHSFYIGATSEPKNQTGLEVEAYLSSDPESSHFVYISFIIPHRLNHPLWKVSVNLLSLQLLETPQGPLVQFTGTKSRDCNCSDEIPSWNIYNGGNGREVNLKEHCSPAKTILVDWKKAHKFLPKYSSGTIYFKLRFTISKPKPDEEIMPPTSIIKDPESIASQAMRNDFKALLDDSKATSDVKIKVTQGKGKSFLCHQLILGARSPYFSEIFNEDEYRENIVVVVDDISPEVMSHFIHFLYSGDFQDDSWIQCLPQLAAAADKFRVKSLKDLCDSHLIQCLTSRNALQLAKLAERHGLPNAASNIRKVISQNAKELQVNRCNSDSKRK